MDVITTFAKRLFDQKMAQKATEDFDTIFKNFMQTIGTRRIVEISETTRKIIENIIINNSDLGVAGITALIIERFGPRFTRARSATISRTETHTASAFAVHEQAKQFNEPTLQKRWISNNDERTRPSHAQANGQQIGLDDDFTIGGKKMSYAGDPKGGASEVINCRCVIAYLEEDDEVLE